MIERAQVRDISLRFTCETLGQRWTTVQVRKAKTPCQSSPTFRPSGLQKRAFDGTRLPLSKRRHRESRHR